MKKIFERIKNKPILKPLMEIAIGLTFLCIEIRDYLTLYSFAEADQLYGGLVDFVKYKENTYSEIFLWSILVLTGIFFWINKKIYWIFTQVFLLLFFFKIGLSVLAISLLGNVIIAFVIPLLYLFLLVWIEIRFLRIGQIEGIEISTQTKILGGVLGFLCCIGYFFLL